jgi:hypothetical protein
LEGAQRLLERVLFVRNPRGTFVWQGGTRRFCFKNLAFGTEGKAQEATIGFLGWMDGALWHGSAIVIVFHWDALVGGLFGGGYTPSYFIKSYVARIESIEDFLRKTSYQPHSQ